MLPVVLHCLAAQTLEDFEVIVTDNSDPEVQRRNHRSIAHLEDARFCHFDTSHLPVNDCYWAAEWAALHECAGNFLCFPSDDSYYVPCFAEVVLGAAERNNWDLVYCNMVYDARFNGQCYTPVNVQPMVNSIDKTGFIVRRSWFEGFPGKVSSGPCKADGLLIESLLSRGIRHGKVSDVLMVHN